MAKKPNNLNTILLAIIALLLVVLIGVLAFNKSDRNHMDSKRGNNSSSDYRMNEEMFASMMIPHHQQAVDMSNLALTNTTNPQVLDLAQRIKTAQEKEIIQMKTWATNENMMMDHSGHGMDMGGMLTDEELAKLATLKDKEFDVMFLESMIVHHEGALQMTQMILNSSNPEVKTLADNIMRSQTEEIAEMKQILANLK